MEKLICDICGEEMINSYECYGYKNGVRVLLKICWECVKKGKPMEIKIKQ